MSSTGRSQRTRLLRTRVGLTLLDGLLTGLFAYAFAYEWTDEAVAGSPYAIADPQGAALEGASAGLLPMLVGLGLCGLLLAGTAAAWWWPALLVVGAGAVGATLGASARFAEGMPPEVAATLVPVALLGAAGLVVDTRSLRRRAVAGP